MNLCSKISSISLKSRQHQPKLLLASSVHHFIRSKMPLIHRLHKRKKSKHKNPIRTQLKFAFKYNLCKILCICHTMSTWLNSLIQHLLLRITLGNNFWLAKDDASIIWQSLVRTPTFLSTFFAPYHSFPMNQFKFGKWKMFTLWLSILVDVICVFWSEKNCPHNHLYVKLISKYIMMFN